MSMLLAEKLNVKKPPKTNIVRCISVTMAMDVDTFRELCNRVPFVSNLLQLVGNVTFLVPIDELDIIMPVGWSFNTFKTSKTSTTCQF